MEHEIIGFPEETVTVFSTIIASISTTIAAWVLIDHGKLVERVNLMSEEKSSWDQVGKLEERLRILEINHAKRTDIEALSLRVEARFDSFQKNQTELVDKIVAKLEEVEKEFRWDGRNRRGDSL